MNRQIKAEITWLVPYRFQARLGSFEFTSLIALSQKQIVRVFVQRPPLHRLKLNMAEIFFSAIRRIREEYAGDASRIWSGTPGSATLVRRFLEFEGAGEKIATMAANSLVRDFKIPVSDRYSLDISADVQVGRAFERLGLVRQNASKEELIYAGRELNPTYPGVLDLAAWEIGKDWCHPRVPECGRCSMQDLCPTSRNLGRLN